MSDEEDNEAYGTEMKDIRERARKGDHVAIGILNFEEGRYITKREEIRRQMRKIL